MTKNSNNPGDDETFNLHCLQFYMPMIAEITLERHKLGLGIFTMQGFERRNKESKNTLRSFCNGKGRFLTTNMRRLHDLFLYRQNAY